MAGYGDKTHGPQGSSETLTVLAAVDSVNMVPKVLARFLEKGSPENSQSTTIATKVTIQGMEKYVLKNDTRVSAVVQKGVFTLLLLFQFWPQRGCAAVPSTLSQQGQGPRGDRRT